MNALEKNKITERNAGNKSRPWRDSLSGRTRMLAAVYDIIKLWRISARVTLKKYVTALHN